MLQGKSDRASLKKRQQAETAASPQPSFAPLLAGFLANAIVSASARFTDQRELLLLITALVYLLCALLREGTRLLFLLDDSIVDRYEAVALQLFSFVQWTLSFMIPLFLFGLASDALFGWTLPLWHEGILLAAIVLLAVLVVQPRLFDAIGHAASFAPTDDDDEEEEEEEGGEETEDGDTSVARPKKPPNTGAADAAIVAAQSSSRAARMNAGTTHYTTAAFLASTATDGGGASSSLYY